MSSHTLFPQETRVIPTQVIYYPSFDPDERWLRAMLLVTDQVIRIIPNDAGHQDPEYVERLGSVLPGAIVRESPGANDTSLDAVNLQRLSKALSHIRETSSGLDRIEVIVGPGGTIELPGKVWIHESKLSREVSRLLEENELIDDVSTSLVREIGRDDVFVVPAAASDLVLSYVADNIARRLGCNTATDAPIAFAVNALDGLQVHPEGRVRGSLLSAIIQLEIPLEVQTLSAEQYAQLRYSYMDIRGALAEVTTQLSSVHQLSASGNSHVVLQKVLGAAQHFHNECEKFRSAKANRNFTRWIPIGLGGLLTVGAEVIDQPEIAIGAAASCLLINLVQEALRKDTGQRDNVYRQLTDLRRDILNPAHIRSFV
ncbi:hypothetical protein [Longimicrobium sp.]|uniref:hypothetical protein n=1 Tax=Longimicrobium sp. TaxID=2029185 RepID=UPI003B3AC75D